MATALELTRKEWRKFVDAASKRPPFPGPTAKEQAERDVLLIRVKEAAKELKKQFGVDRVMLFGSLVEQQWYSANSDVDLAVHGLKPKDYWQALRVVENIIDNRNIDLVEIEAASQSLRDSIDRFGVEL